MESSSQRHELIRREPIFHHPELIWDAGSFDEQIAEDFDEVGASGRRYSRSEVKEIVLGRLEGTHADSLADGYRIEEEESRILADDVVQVLYTLCTPSRVTRRSTLYRRRGSIWQAVFHQGTVIEDATALSPDD